MKICFLLGDITAVGGIERVTSMLSSYLAENRDIQIDIVSQFKGRENPNYEISDKIRCVYVNPVKTGKRPYSIKRLINLLRNVSNIRRYFKHNSYDYIIAQAFPNNFILYLSGISLKNVIAAEHVHHRYYGKIIRALRLFIYKKVYRVVVLTSKDGQYFKTHLPQHKVCVIPNPVDMRNCCQASLEGKKIITIGRLEYQKGFDHLITIFKAVHQKHPDWRLDIYGMGTLQEQLQHQIATNELQGVVTLCGVTDDVLQVLRNYAFFVSTSRFEGFHMALVEAMSQGVPCVSFDCPNGPSDIIYHKTDGILVENQNTAAMEAAINRMIEDAEYRKRLGQEALKNVQRFDISAIGNQWMQLFQKS